MNDQLAFEAVATHQRADNELLGAAYSASEAIEREEIAYLDNEKVLREHRSRVDTIEARIAAEVGREKDENSEKPRFSNDTQRRAETALRLSADGAYRDEVRSLAEAENEQRLRRLKIERLTRSYALNKLAFEALTIGRRER